jgi:hypothetical protein
MKELPRLPIGLQYFADIRRDESLYVDKTEYIYEICRPSSVAYFLSRPRRFGKSLTLDTINELFSGNKALFEGLWIADKWDWSQTYPVIRLSLDAIGHKNGLEAALIETMHDLGNQYEIDLTKTTSGSLFKELIEKLHKKTGKQIVILIDEYDKPIVEHLDPTDLTKAKGARDILKQFFSILKNSSKYIRLLFITGVSKFARVSIFSDLNHLIDLTLNKQFSGLCGYTQLELEHYFEPYLKKMPADTLEKMKNWYNGYSWDAKTFVYNPFSVLNFFYSQDYGNYWFSSGTPTFLVKLIRQKFEFKLEEKEVGHSILDAFTLDKLDKLAINSLLLQTGYLTIKNITQEGTFILNYPNNEVKNAFGQLLLSEYTDTNEFVPYGIDVSRALEKNDLARAIEVIDGLIQAVPDQNYIKNEEKFFHAIIHLIFTMIGADIRSEVHTPIGRIDSVVITKERIFLFEFKMNETAQSAIQCVKDRHYAEHLRHRNKEIVAVGVCFSPNTKGVADWAKEVI